MYRIMVVVEETANNTSKYQYLKVKNNKNVHVIWETDDPSVLEEQVESMLNGDYKKKDFIVIQPVDYEIDTNLNKEIGDSTEPDVPDSVDPEPTNDNGE